MSQSSNKVVFKTFEVACAYYISACALRYSGKATHSPSSLSRDGEAPACRSTRRHLIPAHAAANKLSGMAAGEPSGTPSSSLGAPPAVGHASDDAIRPDMLDEAEYIRTFGY